MNKIQNAVPIGSIIELDEDGSKITIHTGLKFSLSRMLTMQSICTNFLKSIELTKKNSKREIIDMIIKCGVAEMVNRALEFQDSEGPLIYLVPELKLKVTIEGCKT